MIVYLRRRVEPLGYIVPQGRDGVHTQSLERSNARIRRLEGIIDQPVPGAERVRVLFELSS